MDIIKYINFLEYPSRVVRKCPICGFIFSMDTNFCLNCGENVGLYYKECLALYKKQKTEFDDNEDKLMKQFKKDALEYVGLSTLSNKDKIYDLAWREGRPSGLEEVICWLEDLAELFK